MWVVVGVAVTCALAVAAVPVTRRAFTVFAVFSWRLAPVLLRKLRLGFRDYTAARGVRLAFEDLGPAYLKFGQMIASSPASFSSRITDEFARCLDEVRPLSVLRVWKILERELGAHPEEVFASIDPKPLASASIAQVHRATLKDGRKVVQGTIASFRDRIEGLSSEPTLEEIFFRLTEGAGEVRD